MNVTKRRGIDVWLPILIVVIMGTFFQGCTATTGEWTLQSVESDKVLGSEIDRQVDEEIGILRDPAFDAYIYTIGRRLTLAHTDQRFQYSFRIVDQVEPNAFAAPGGYIYLSRGLLVLINTEDELAGILAHEIIHVNRRHKARQMAEKRLTNLLDLPGKVVKNILSRALGNWICAPMTGLGSAYMAAYSRCHEYEADRLGQRLAARAGYDPQSFAAVLDRLALETQLRGNRNKRPRFFDSHPTGPNRVKRLIRDARDMEWHPLPGVARDSGDLLQQLDGLLIGPNPADGIFEGRRFLHPILGLSITLPQGWEAMNTKQAVMAVSPNKDALLVLDVVGKQADLRNAVAVLIQMIYEDFQVTHTRSESTRIGDLPAHMITYTDTTGEVPTYLYFHWVTYHGLLYRLTGLAVEGKREVLKETAFSFRPLSREERGRIKETRLHIMPANGSETLSQLCRRTESSWDPKTASVMNGIPLDQPLREGQRIKIALSRPFQAHAVTRR
jgi:predicted Zn-dependent protease